MDSSNDPHPHPQPTAEPNLVQKALRESEARNRGIVESVPAAIVCVDHRNVITEFNPEAQRVFGWCREQVIGQHLADVIVAPALREQHRPDLQRLLSDPMACGTRLTLELPAVRSDGSEFPIEMAVARVDAAGAPRFTVLIRDIGARRRVEADVRRQADRMAAIVDAQHELALSDMSSDQLHDRIAAMAQRLLGGDGVQYLLLQGDELVVHSAGGLNGPELGKRIPFQGSLGGLAISQGITLRCDDAQTDPRVHTPPGLTRDWKSLLVSVLRIGALPVGAIAVCSTQRARFSETDSHALELLAESIGAVLQRRRHAKALEASESQYRSLFIDNPHPMCVYEQRTLRFLAVNKAGLALYGCTEAAVLTLTLDALAPPEDRDAWRREFDTPYTGLRSYTARHCKKNGDIVYIDTTSNDILFEGRQARVVLGTDITERRRANIELSKSEARFRALTELSADWFWEQDENFRYVNVSTGGRWPKDALSAPPPLLGKTQWELDGVEMDDWQAVREKFQTHEPFYNLEARRRLPDGTQQFVEISGAPAFSLKGRFTGYRGITRDVTENRRAQQALHESQRTLSTLLGNLVGMAYRCRNDPDRPMVFVSQGALELTGYLPAQLISGEVTYDELIAPADRQAVWDTVQEAVASGRQFEVDYRITARDGTVKWVLEQGLGLRDAAGELVAFEGYVTDITERREAQEENRRLHAELEQRVRQRTAQLEAANKELESFAYSIAHDLRAPLTSIDGFSHMLEEGFAALLDDQGRRYLGRVRAGVRQMAHLTDGMLSLARLSGISLESEPVDLAALAREEVVVLREREPTREAVLEAPEHLWARGDRRLLAQVVRNLVGNAWKFSARKPRIHITLGSEFNEAGEQVFFVADQGAGFDMDYASRLFSAFQRLHPAADFEGTGIGLALVQKILNRHGGRIWAQAQPDRGATFCFTLGSSELA